MKRIYRCVYWRLHMWRLLGVKCVLNVGSDMCECVWLDLCACECVYFLPLKDSVVFLYANVLIEQASRGHSSFYFCPSFILKGSTALWQTSSGCVLFVFSSGLYKTKPEAEKWHVPAVRWQLLEPSCWWSQLTLDKLTQRCSWGLQMFSHVRRVGPLWDWKDLSVVELRGVLNRARSRWHHKNLRLWLEEIKRRQVMHHSWFEGRQCPLGSRLKYLTSYLRKWQEGLFVLHRGWILSTLSHPQIFRRARPGGFEQNIATAK